MHVYILDLFNSCNLEALWESLTAQGFNVLYSEELPNSHIPNQLYIAAAGSSLEALQAYCAKLPQIAGIRSEVLPTIDWEKQWAYHAQGFTDGKLTLQLTDTYSIHLIPGPGFGDLSHPTTRLMLRLLIQLPKQSYSIVDVGCGSGILTLASAHLQHPPILGIDCDLDALEHASKNACLNGLDSAILWKLPQDVTGREVSYPFVLLMNMISSEQEMAWKALPKPYPEQASWLITSGVPLAERESYCIRWQQRGWICHLELEEEGWLGWLWKSI